MALFRKKTDDAMPGVTGAVDAPGVPGASKAGNDIWVEGEQNPFFGQEQRAKSAKERSNKLVVLGVVVVFLLLLAVFLPHNMFSSTTHGITLATWIDQLRTNVSDFVAAVTGTNMGGTYQITICKYVLVAFAGAALGACGTVYQGSLKNALASPTTLGVTSGCTMGATLFILFLQTPLVGTEFVNASVIIQQLEAMDPLQYAWQIYGRTFFSLLGGFAVITVVLLFSRILGKGKASNIVLIVVGQVISIVFGSVLSMIRYYLDQTGQQTKLDALSALQLDAFSSVGSLLDVALFCIPVIVLMAVVLALRSKIGLLSFSDEESRSMGIATSRLRLAVVLLCTALTAIVVSFCGTIGFVGFIVPHITRRIMGADFRFLIPASMLMGAAFLLVTYFLSGQFDFLASPLNLLTSVIGCIAFLGLAWKTRGDSRAAWV